MTINQDINYYLTLPYTIELTPDEDGDWVARIPLLKGCITHGTTRDEALKMLDEAQAAWLEVALEVGKAIPEPEPHTIEGQQSSV